MNANLYGLFATRFPEDREACAIETPDGGFYSWSDLERASARLAHLLAGLGLESGARVAVQIDPSPEALLLYLATLRAGLVYVPIEPACREAELEYLLADARPAVVVCRRITFSWVSKLAFANGSAHVFTLDAHRSGSLLDRAAWCPEHFVTAHSEPHHPAVILYTPDLTGHRPGERPKGAILTHGNLAANALMLQDRWGWEKSDVLLLGLPLTQAYGLLVAGHGALLIGCKTIFLSSFDAAEVVRLLPRVTVFMGEPAHYGQLLATPGFNGLASLNMRLFVSGGSPLPIDIFDRFIDHTGHTILEYYGLPECPTLASNPYRGRRIGGTVGLPLPGVSIRVVNDDGLLCEAGQAGRIEVKGGNVFAAYWRMPETAREHFTVDGYFRTGVRGKFGPKRAETDGYLSIIAMS